VDAPAPDPGNSPPEQWTAELPEEEERDVEVILAALAGPDDV
jgi:hypothetical protein